MNIFGGDTSLLELLDKLEEAAAESEEAKAQAYNLVRCVIILLETREQSTGVLYELWLHDKRVLHSEDWRYLMGYAAGIQSMDPTAAPIVTLKPPGQRAVVVWPRDYFGRLPGSLNSSERPPEPSP